MEVILNNGATICPLVIVGEYKHFKGDNRDTLSFIFPADADMTELDSVFTTENCSKITVVDGGSEFIHKGYVVRESLAKVPVLIASPTETTEAIYETRVKVTMGQQSDVEKQLSTLVETVDALVIDSLMG